MSGVLSLIGAGVAGAVAWAVAVKLAKKAARLDEWNAAGSFGKTAIAPARVKNGVSYYRLTKPYKFRGRAVTDWGAHPIGAEIIPSGFEFDGASVPQFFWTLVGSPFSANLLEAALIHDYRYRVIFSADSPLTRDEKREEVKKADAEFYINLRESGNRKILAAVCFAAVRAYSTLRGIK